MTIPAMPIFLAIFVLGLTLSNRARAGFRFRPKRSALFVIAFFTSIFFLAGGRPSHIYEAYADIRRGYIADSLMEKTITGRTLGFSSHVDLDRYEYSSLLNEFRYRGTFMLLGVPVNFTGNVKIVCDDLRPRCMKADYSRSLTD